MSAVDGQKNGHNRKEGKTMENENYILSRLDYLKAKIQRLYIKQRKKLRYINSISLEEINNINSKIYNLRQEYKELKHYYAMEKLKESKNENREEFETKVQ